MSWEVFVPAPVMRGKLKGKEFLSLNSNMHWAPQAKIKKAWRQAATRAAQAACLPVLLPKVGLTATVHKRSNAGRWETSNLAPVTKAIVDGLVDYGLVEDDTDDYVVGPLHERGEARPETPGVVISVELV